jgi:hypothetical protein
LSRRSWNGQDCTKLVAIIGQHQSWPEAVAAIQRDEEFAGVTPDMVYGAFRRNKLLAPTAYLAKAFAGAEPPDFDDDVTSPNVTASARAQAVRFSETRDTQPAPKEPDGESLRVFVLPDIHSPYHDERALEAALLGGRRWLEQVPSRRRVVLIQGDAQDNFKISFHRKMPGRGKNLEHEVAVTCQVLDMVESLGAERVVFTEGNHEQRLERYLIDKAPELFGMISMQQLLRFDRRPGWEWIPFKSHAFIGDTLCTHELGFVGKYALTHTANSAACSTLTGHTHRIGVSEVADVHGSPRTSSSFGWLGRLEDIDYMYEAVAKREWAHGFGTGLVDSRGRLYTWPHRIHDGRTVVDGYEIAA